MADQSRKNPARPEKERGYRLYSEDSKQHAREFSLLHLRCNNNSSLLQARTPSVLIHVSVCVLAQIDGMDFHLPKGIIDVRN